MSDTLCVSAYSRRGIVRRRCQTATDAHRWFNEWKQSRRYQAILVVYHGECIRRYMTKQTRAMPTYGRGKIKVRLYNALANMR